MAKFFTIILLLLVVNGCTSVPGRLQKADSIASQVGLTKSLIKTEAFTFTAYKKITDKNAPLNIYIEGDGFAWATRSRLSTNPTPRNPLALKLAAKDRSKNVVYLARPCQYTDFKLSPSCHSRFWSSDRFSKLVVNSMNKAIEKLKKDSGTKEINLIGYSGGGAIAVIIAAIRNDVGSIRTVAGNLDHMAVNKFHSVTPLKNSLNPIDYAQSISNIPQYHFTGVEDNVVPTFIAKNFARQTANENKCVKVSSLNGATHHAGWADNWPKLLSRPIKCDK